MKSNLERPTVDDFGIIDNLKETTQKEDNINQERKEDTLIQERKEQFLGQERKEQILVQERKESILGQERKEPFLSQERRESILSQERKDSFLNQERKEPFLNKERKDPLIEQDRKELSQNQFVGSNIERKEQNIFKDQRQNPTPQPENKSNEPMDIEMKSNEDDLMNLDHPPQIPLYTHQPSVADIKSNQIPQIASSFEKKQPDELEKEPLLTQQPSAP
jgi:hypothetical protein